LSEDGPIEEVRVDGDVANEADHEDRSASVGKRSVSQTSVSRLSAKSENLVDRQLKKPTKLHLLSIEIVRQARAPAREGRSPERKRWEDLQAKLALIRERSKSRKEEQGNV